MIELNVIDTSEPRSGLKIVTARLDGPIKLDDEVTYDGHAFRVVGYGAVRPLPGTAPRIDVIDLVLHEFGKE